MDNSAARIVIGAAMAGQYVLGFIIAVYLLRAVLERRPRFAHLLIGRWRVREVPDAWLRLVRLKRNEPSFKERERLLAGCGFIWDAAWYAVLRRLFFITTPLLAGAAYGLSRITFGPIPPMTAPLALALFVMLLLWDRPWLDAYRRARTERMTKEIYMVSNQLLYLTGSSLHIHTKLMRSLSFTKAMRTDLQLLLGEWYHDAEGALRRFKLRLGTEEGLSFAETIDSLRLHESEHYYDLLRERIQDYKEKLELAKESRKESTSYILFVLAGIPILYTFQIFIYPWVKEGQKLFESLN